MVARQKPIFFFANLMNLILATGVFTLPFSLYETGFILGSLILFFICIISIIASTFIIEVLGIQNCIRKNEKDVVVRASILTHNRTSYYSIKFEENKFSQVFQNSKEDKKQTFNTPVYSEQDSSKNPFLNTQNNDNITTGKDKDLNQKNVLIENLIKKKIDNNNESIDADIELEMNDEFYIAERYEIAKLSNKIFNKFAYFSVTFILIGYLYVSLTSNGIIVGNSLLKVLPKTFDVVFKDEYYDYIVLCFYSLVLLISLNNINKLKSFGMIIMIFRVIIILLIFSLCFYTMSTDTGIANIKEVPLFNFSNITIMIGNSLFFFMSHHSIPGMVENFYPQKNLIKLLITGYLCSLIVMILYGGVAILTFSQVKDCDCTNFPCAIQDMFNLNFLAFPKLGLLINYYPLFNLITASIQLITLKNNILQAIGSCSRDLLIKIDYNKISGAKGLFVNFFISFFVALPSISLAIGMRNIQSLMKYFSSTFGFLLMIVIPIALIYKFRSKINDLALNKGKLNRSFINKNYQLFFMGFCGLCILIVIVIGFFHKNNKKCIFDP